MQRHPLSREVNELLLFLIFAVCGLLPWVLTIWNIYNLIRRRRRGTFEGIALFLGGMLSIILYNMWGTVPWDQPVNSMAGSLDAGYIHEPLSGEHAAFFLIWNLAAIAAYLFLKFREAPLPPLASVLLAFLVLGGCVSQVLVLVQFGVSDDWMVGYLRILPVNFLLMALFLFRDLLERQAEIQKNRTYSNRLLKALNTCLIRTARWSRVVVFFLLPLLLICAVLLLLFGQQPDGFLRVFTQTSDWTLSAKISPPPVAYDTHYLCTVSLRGHRKLVRPIRYGIRRGEKIVVNRQLCVANAFEELIQERAPRFHRAVRHFYDTWGYPVSRWIQSAAAADAVYLVMKPLEWLFTVVLYLFDTKPENRIARQYLPAEALAGAKEQERETMR